MINAIFSPEKLREKDQQKDLSELEELAKLFVIITYRSLAAEKKKPDKMFCAIISAKENRELEPMKQGELAVQKHDYEEENGDCLKSLDSLSSSEDLPFYHEPEEETVFQYFEDTDDDSLTEQMNEFLQVLPSMNRQYKPLRDELDKLLKEIDELLAEQPSSSEGSVCGEDYNVLNQ